MSRPLIVTDGQYLSFLPAISTTTATTPLTWWMRWDSLLLFFLFGYPPLYADAYDLTLQRIKTYIDTIKDQWTELLCPNLSDLVVVFPFFLVLFLLFFCRGGVQSLDWSCPNVRVLVGCIILSMWGSRLLSLGHVRRPFDLCLSCLQCPMHRHTHK